MADVSFSEPQFGQNRAVAKRSLLMRMAFASGLVKTEEGAQKLLVVVFVAALVLAVAVPLLFSSKEPAPLPASDFAGMPHA